ncbi:sulfur carrier protein ThiS [Alkaliphilus peptidifermentans]|uniref:Sulfur carrier protein n=1 Tax=Alkaliphilus peptidifermentans DSM 18978 TaxID=1120976 RepID=A0A1G5D7F1_9FIRM|nr:sulfur carrier protein ThiS [Alkaliphilus peptidifermentans]SCY10769.1 sulfur carrier protein [Alkaliphilus peptidifermentans DSM 18978]
MIKVNSKDFEWEEGLTVQVLLDKKKYTFPKIFVTINGKHIDKEDFDTTLINDGDDVKVVHLLAGG